MADSPPLFDGRREKNRDKLWMINDHRAKLASEIVTAETHGLLATDRAAPLVEDLIFDGADFFDMEERFLAASKDAKTLVRFLRGYATPGMRKYCR